jgi:O-antigen ligase
VTRLALTPAEAGVVALFPLIAAKDGLLLVREPVPVSLFHVVLALTVAAWAWQAIRNPQTRFQLRLAPLEAALALVVVAGLWSLPFSAQPGDTASYTARLLMLGVLALVIGRNSRAEARRVALIAFVASSTALAVFALAQWAIPTLAAGNAIVQAIEGTTFRRPAGFYIDPNFMASHLVAAILVALAFTMRSSASRERVLFAGAALIMVAAVFVSYSRTAWMLLLIGVIVVLALSPGRIRRPIGFALLAVVVGGILLAGPALVAERLLSAVTFEGNLGRYNLAASSVEMIADRPVFGTGLEAFDEVYPAYRRPGSDAFIVHPHQVPLGFVAETGVAGVLALLAVAGAAAAAARRRLAGGRAAADVAVVAVVAVLALGSLAQWVLYFEPLWMFLGLLAIPSAKDRLDGRSPYGE